MEQARRQSAIRAVGTSDLVLSEPLLRRKLRSATADMLPDDAAEAERDARTFAFLIWLHSWHPAMRALDASESEVVPIRPADLEAGVRFWRKPSEGRVERALALLEGSGALELHPEGMRLTPDVLAHEAFAKDLDWPRLIEAADRNQSVILALSVLAREIVPAGQYIEISVRELGRHAGISMRSARRAVEQLEAASVISRQSVAGSADRFRFSPQVGADTTPSAPGPGATSSPGASTRTVEIEGIRLDLRPGDVFEIERSPSGTTTWRLKVGGSEG